MKCKNTRSSGKTPAVAPPTSRDRVNHGRVSETCGYDSEKALVQCVTFSAFGKMAVMLHGAH